MALKPHYYAFGDWDEFQARQQQQREEREMQQREENRMKPNEQNRGTVVPVGVAALIQPIGREVARSLSTAAFEGSNPTQCGNRSCVGFQRTRGKIVNTAHGKTIDNQVQTLVCPHCSSRWQNVPAVRQVLEQGKKS